MIEEEQYETLDICEEKGKSVIQETSGIKGEFEANCCHGMKKNDKD